MKNFIYLLFLPGKTTLQWGLKTALPVALYIFSLSISPAHALGHPEIVDVISVDVSECPNGYPGLTACYKYSWKFSSNDIPGNLFFPHGKFDVLVNSSGDNYLQTNAPWSFGVPNNSSVTWASLIQTMINNTGTSGEGIYSAPIHWKGCFTFGVSDNRQSHQLPGAKCFRAPPPQVSCNFNLDNINIDFGTLNTKEVNGAQRSVPVTLTCSSAVTASISNLDNGNITLKNGGNAGLTASLYVNGTSLASEQQINLAAGDNALTVMATLKTDGNIVAGDYSASTILSIALQ
ncbi:MULTISPECIES: MrpH family fimbial adhesin [Tenebrionibacter/Tenebrionicola group]|jgi:hypothetical protein|uniref:Fimbrial adhesin MrpH C-terminal domain-containing protein n=2 Tax=Tenebrionibacter/Tenebrionicola group TaxID=2969848 RepID=A0A8K0XYK3_9ENTR|nr:MULTISPECIES: hypothetical protein [Tenebrionibacter/Tenebrionicola group]MBK4714649.1 hypothetical protein [Tenebrionibacter intestinalis]MBV4413712.1 hypothetical protein [Tenebrionicola larvae]MBV5095103.1 hypothetical protein [Tenebrionicola larvae]